MSTSHPLEEFANDDGKLNYEVDSKDAQRVVQWFSHERYEDISAAVKEIIGNAFTACYNANQYRESYEPKIVVSFEESPDMNTLYISDNGEGFTPEMVNKQLRHPTKSGNSDDGSVLGRYGIGSYSGMILKNPEGEYRFETKSVKTGDSFAFTLDGDGIEMIDGGRESYGTTVSIDTLEEISVEDIEVWIDDILVCPPVDVEVNVNGKTKMYESKKLVDTYDGDPLHYEDKYMEITCGYRGDNFVLYNGMPVRGIGHLPEFGYHCVRVNIKREDGIVYDGYNEGKIPKRDKFFKETKNHIKPDDLGEDDKTLPVTTSDRERLKKETREEFSNYVFYKLKELAEEYVEENFHNSDVVESLKDETTYNMLKMCVQRFNLYKGDNDLRAIFSYKSLSIVQNGTSRPELVSNRKNTSIYNLLNLETDNYYVGKTINKRKCEVLENVYGDDVAIVCIDDQSGSGFDYDHCQRLFGWQLLKDVPLSQKELEEMGVDDETIKSVVDPENYKPSSVESQSISVYGKSYRYGKKSNRKNELKNIRTSFTDSNQYLLLFPDTGEEKISNNKDLSSRRINIARCNKQQSEYLLKCDNVYDYNKIKDSIGDVCVDGVNIKENSDDIVIFFATQDISSVILGEREYVKERFEGMCEDEWSYYDGFDSDKDLIFMFGEDIDVCSVIAIEKYGVPVWQPFKKSKLSVPTRSRPYNQNLYSECLLRDEFDEKVVGEIGKLRKETIDKLEESINR